MPNSMKKSNNVANLISTEIKSPSEDECNSRTNKSETKEQASEWGEIRSHFNSIVYDQVKAWCGRVTAKKDLPISEQIQTLKNAQAIIDAEIRELLATIPSKAPELWRDRNKELDENPYEFAYRVYKKWFGLITRGMLQKLDGTLVVAMYRHDVKHGAPDDHTYIPPKDGNIVNSMEPVTWNDVLASAPEETVKLMRIYFAQQREKRTIKKAI